MKYILVSTSPRRIELMKLLGVDYEIISPKLDEEKMLNVKEEDPERYVEYMAEKKCESVIGLFKPNEIIFISADTIVYLERKTLGKPKDVEQACEILKQLSGKWHTVFTGVCIIHNEEKLKFVERTDVLFREIEDETIQEYVNSGEPMDKAGAYSIQGKGALFVRRIIGDYYNVVGFPVGRIWEELKKKGWL